MPHSRPWTFFRIALLTCTIQLIIFKVDNSVVFSVFPGLCNHQHSLFLNSFITLKYHFPNPHSILLSPLLCSVAKSCLSLCSPMKCSTPAPWPLLFPRVCSDSCPLSPRCPGQQLVYFLPQWICLLWTFHKNKIVYYMVLCELLPTLSIVLLIHPCYGM